jgi:predicted HTH transcriptional regulator
MAIPSGHLPGHQRTQKRVEAALGRLFESRDLDFKKSAPWVDLKSKIIKTAMAMSNIRDGGTIVIGVDESGDTWQATGILPEHLATYDPDVIASQINVYASPAISPILVTVDIDGKCFLAIDIPEFAQLPVICQQNGSDGLIKGTIFVRPTGTPRTERPANAEELREVIDIAGEKSAARIFDSSRRAGLLGVAANEDQFEKERGSL